MALKLLVGMVNFILDGKRADLMTFEKAPWLLCAECRLGAGHLWMYGEQVGGSSGALTTGKVAGTRIVIIETEVGGC